MSSLTLRDYQAECVEAHYAALSTRDANPLMEVPTGGGKSLIIAEFISRTIDAWPNARVLMLTHSQELIEQNHDELVGQWPGAICPVGIWSAGLNRREPHAQIVFASVQSCLPSPSKPREEMLQRFDLVLIDEAHLVPKIDGGRYRTYLAMLRDINPNLRVIGYTATPYRLDGGMLHEGDGALFTEIAYCIGVERLIEGGYLCNLRAKRAEAQIDTRGVRKQSGDWSAKQLEERAMEGDHVAVAIDEAVPILRAENRTSWLIFAIGIDHAHAIVDALERHGVHAETVFGDTPKTERRDRIARFKDGYLEALVNVGCLTTGFNAPRCDAMIVMRPTQSVSLYVQMMGRGMRTFPGKADCLVLDYGMNVARHGPINQVAVDSQGPADDGKAPTKACPKCKEEILIAVMICPSCGHEFESSENDRSHQTAASDLSPVAWDTEPPKPQEIVAIEADYHHKAGSPTSLRMTYLVGMHRVSEWVCFEHRGFPRRKAMEWWLERGGGVPVPDDCAEAVARFSEIRVPGRAVVKREGKYWRVLKLIDKSIDMRWSDLDILTSSPMALNETATMSDGDPTDPHGRDRRFDDLPF